MFQYLVYAPYTVPLLLVAFILRLLIRRVRVRSISQLPGPQSGSWLVGNLPDLLRPEEAAEAELAWTDNYGTAVRIKGALGLDILFTADPKALQYMLNTSAYHFPKPQQNVATTRLTAGKGLLWAQSLQHARQRKIINPAFSYNALKRFLPPFRDHARKTVLKWKEIFGAVTSSTVIDIPSWLARTTLDALGEAALNYDFGAIDEGDNELTRAYGNLFVDLFFKRSDFTLVFEALWGYLPLIIVDIIQKIPTKQLVRVRNYMTVSRGVARNILYTQKELYEAGKEGGNDLMSLLYRANLSENEKLRISDDEIMSQLTTLMLAGHETTASTISWVLYELSLHPECQAKVRDEIRLARVQAVQRGDTELTMSDMESMKYLLAVIKETLRFHPIVTTMNREAAREDLIPLSKPLTTRTGDVITAIPVSKGQRIIISLAAYNRLKSIWGYDANMWRPERFLGHELEDKVRLGMVSNIGSFSSGTRNCIGWRFAMIEMQAVLAEFLENFEFSPAPGNPEIIGGATGVIVSPMLKTSPGSTQLPLTVKLVAV